MVGAGAGGRVIGVSARGGEAGGGEGDAGGGEAGASDGETIGAGTGGVQAMVRRLELAQAGFVVVVEAELLG